MKQPLQSIEPKTSIGELLITPSKSQLFMYSAVTWNRHKIHFDHAQAEFEGFPKVVVHRGLIGNFFARLITNWISDRGQLERLQWRVLKSAFPDQELKCSGFVEKTYRNTDDNYATCTLHLTNHIGESVASGEATVKLY